MKAADLQNLSEDDRIKVIAKYITDNPNEKVGVAIEAISKNKIKRYIKKVMLECPEALVDTVTTTNQLSIIKFKNKNHSIDSDNNPNP